MAEMQKQFAQLTPEQQQAAIMGIMEMKQNLNKDANGINQLTAEQLANAGKGVDMFEEMEKGVKRNFHNLKKAYPDAFLFSFEATNKDKDSGQTTPARFVYMDMNGEFTEVPPRAFIENMLGGANFTGVLATMGAGEDLTEQEEAETLIDTVIFFDYALKEIGKKAFVYNADEDDFYFIDLFDQTTQAKSWQFINLENLVEYMTEPMAFFKAKREELTAQLAILDQRIDNKKKELGQ